MPSENPPSERQRKPRPSWQESDPGLEEWHDQEKYFWRNHEQILAIQHVLGLSAHCSRIKPITVFVDVTADVDAVRSSIHACMAKLGLPDDHYTVEMRIKSASTTPHRLYVPHKYPENAPSDAV